MSRMKDVDIIMKELSTIPMEFDTYIRLKTTLEHCKKLLRKGNVKKQNTKKVKSKAMKEWREGWFGKEE